MPTRRTIIQTLPLAGLLMSGWAAARPIGDPWQAWKDLYLRDGRVIDQEQNGITHSEGQGYGLLLAQAYGDEEAFRAIEGWTARHLAVRADALMAWKWQPGDSDNIADWHNATDGDLFRAWALLRAARDSGWGGFDDTARAIAHDIAALCLAPDPRARSEWLLLPGAEARHDATRVLINPSYIMPRALRELGTASQKERLVRAADRGEFVLAELAATGFLPNWVDVTEAGFVPPKEHAFLWGYDALRIPLYLVWSGQRDHAAVAVAGEFFGLADTADHLAVEVDGNGDVRAQSDHPGYHAIERLAACSLRSEAAGTDFRQSYYPDSLRLLADVAGRESGCHKIVKPE